VDIARPHLAIERGNVVGLATRDPVLVDDDLLVLPLAAGTADVVLKGVVARESASLDELGRHEEPRRVADRGDRLTGRVDLLDDLARVGVHAQHIGVQCAARQHDRVELLRLRVFQQHVHREAVVLLVVFHALELGLGRQQYRIGARLLEREAGKRELHLLNSIRRQDRNAHALQGQIRHGRTSRSAPCRKEDARIR
jgi:hypothetical protein